MDRKQGWKTWRALCAALLALVTVQFAAAAETPEARASLPGFGKIVVADRDSGTISVIGVRTDEVLATIDLPAGDAPPEPMYVYYTPIMHRVFVGDRANDRVVAFDARTFDVDGIVPAGEGVFHMWGNLFTRQLWVNNDIENTTTVIDMKTLQVIATVPTPADLVEAGGKPHDVIVSPGGLFAYITVLGLEGESDYVVQYFAWTFQEIGRAAVGKDPHLSVTWRRPWLFVPCQGSDAVFVLNRFNMEQEQVIDVPGAHGAGMRLDGRYFYTTNLPGEGEDGLFVIDTADLEVVGEPVDTPFTVPHNIALTPSGRKLYVTHSGPNDKVTVYRTTWWDPVPELVGEVTVGANPFGLDYVP
ncbi:MAG: YncE family protein [Planctomycetota bacterium]|nr:YncE family protein [Planctomycetota bacterium]